MELPDRAPRLPWGGVPLVAGIFFLLLTLHAASLETPTIDEFAHVPAGCAVLEHGRLDLYAKSPPLLRVLMALPVVASGARVPPVTVHPLGWGPWQYGAEFMRANAERYLKLFLWPRGVVIACALLTGLLLHSWSREAFGGSAAAMVTTLFFLSPTVLAHAHLATLDVGCMLSIFASAFVFRWAYRKPAWWRFGLTGAAWGVALAVKFTAVLMLPVFLVLIASYRRREWGRASAELAGILVVAIAVVNLVMGFRGAFQPLGSYAFASSFGQAVANVVPAWLPVPLPFDYVAGFDAQMRDVEAGEFGSYLFGRWSQTGWWFYGLVAFAVKEPLPLLAMLGVAVWRWRTGPLERREALAIVVPLAGLSFFTVFFNRLNIGVRYLLPVFPFLFLFLGVLWRRLERRPVRVFAAAVLLYYAGTVAWVHPAYLSYFNLAAGGSKNGHRVLADSNLDWGQDLYRVKPALQKLGHEGRVGMLYFGHVDPGLYGIDYRLVPGRPVEGVLAVSVHYVLGGAYVATAPDGRWVPIPPERVAWLRRHEPVARAGSIWIYDTRVRRQGR